MTFLIHPELNYLARRRALLADMWGGSQFRIYNVRKPFSTCCAFKYHFQFDALWMLASLELNQN